MVGAVRTSKGGCAHNSKRAADLKRRGASAWLVRSRPSSSNQSCLASLAKAFRFSSRRRPYSQTPSTPKTHRRRRGPRGARPRLRLGCVVFLGRRRVSYAAICSDLQACGAEVMAKKDPLLDLLIRGSRVRIPDGSPRNRHVTRRSAGAGSPWCGLSATLPSSSPQQFRSALARARKKKKAADPRARRFLESGSFVSTASLAR